MIELLNIDCMEYMATLEDKAFDLAIVDPPYGIGRDGYECGSKSSDSWKNPRKKVYANKEWDKEIPDQDYFKEVFRVSENQIIWGGNYFIEHLKSSMGIIAWNKEVNGNFSEFEFAWTSFNQRARLFKWMWNGYRKQQPEVRSHPTQKPVALYKWLLNTYAKDGDKILDTHGGSMSIAIACHQMGFDLTLCEIDKDYYEAGVKRYNEAIKQQTLFSYDTN